MLVPSLYRLDTAVPRGLCTLYASLPPRVSRDFIPALEHAVRICFEHAVGFVVSKNEWTRVMLPVRLLGCNLATQPSLQMVLSSRLQVWSPRRARDVAS